jgi:hypothetical protein
MAFVHKLLTEEEKQGSSTEQQIEREIQNETCSRGTRTEAKVRKNRHQKVHLLSENGRQLGIKCQRS